MYHLRKLKYKILQNKENEALYYGDFPLMNTWPLHDKKERCSGRFLMLCLP